MPNKPIALALIGAGKWGKNYLKSVKDLPQVKIGYVVTAHGEVKIKDLLKKNDINGFIIATPTSTHFQIAKLLIENNKNVLIEKPVTNSYKSTEALFKLSQRHPQAIVMAGHIQLYDPAYQNLKKNLQKVGKIKRLEYIGLKSPKRNDVSVFWDWLPHPVYLFSDLINKKITLKKSVFLPPDNAEVIIDINGVEGKIKIGWTHPQKIRELKVVGEKGEIKMEPVKSRYTPLQNEVITFAKCLRRQLRPPSDLKQALDVAKIIENAKSFSQSEK